MKIGLVRHFKVKKGFPNNFLVTPDEVNQWVEEYDATDIEEGEVDLGGVDWKRCYASDLPRAARTAELIYSGNIIQTEKLREVRPYPFFAGKIKLPMIVWGILVKVAWMIDHKSQVERTADINKRIGAVLDEILAQGDDDVLIVGHAACMMFMRQELIRRGFKGKNTGTPKNGKLYIYEN